MKKMFLSLPIQMEEKKIEILQKVAQIFTMYGVRSVNMDDISRNIGISKKTLYQYCTDKNDLVMQTLTMGCNEDMLMMRQIQTTSETAIHEMLQVYEVVKEIFSKMHPAFFFELKKYHFDAFEKLEEFKNSFILEFMIKNIKRGISEGVYRKNIDPEIVAGIHVVHVTGIHYHEVFVNMGKSWQEIQEQQFRYHIRGLASEKGRSLLRELMDINTDEE